MRITGYKASRRPCIPLGPTRGESPIRCAGRPYGGGRRYTSPVDARVPFPPRGEGGAPMRTPEPSMDVHNRRMRARHLLALAFGIAVTGVATAGTEVRLVEPGYTEILYGRTRVVASVTSSEEVAYVRFRLDRFPNPVCVDDEAPFVCFFDAGTAYQGHRIEAAAVGKDGNVL